MTIDNGFPMKGALLRFGAWLGYHAFLAGHRLAGFVPPVLGLRDGVLYSEWLPQPPAGNPEEVRAILLPKVGTGETCTW